MIWDTLKVPRFYTRAILIAMILAGVIMIAYPVPSASNSVSYSDGFYGDQFNAIVGYAPPGDFASVHLTTGNGVTVILQIALNGAYTPIFNAAFPAGTVDVPGTSVGSGGTLFLTVSSNNRVFTPMNIQASIFKEVATYPYIPLGIGTLGVAAVIVIITRLGQFPLHSVREQHRNRLKNPEPD